LPTIASATGEAVPDTILYTFTLTTGAEEQVTTLWATDAQDNQTIQALLDGFSEVIRLHTGEDIVIR
jgi:hypothetical protein